MMTTKDFVDCPDIEEEYMEDFPYGSYDEVSKMFRPIKTDSTLVYLTECDLKSYWIKNNLQ